MNLTQITAFVKIADNNSFSKTAREMYLTQPTISSCIRTLEKELGTALFIRTTRGVELSEDGERIYLYARQIMEASSAIHKTLHVDDKQKEEQQILVAASTIPSQFILPEIIAEAGKRYPGLRFRVHECDSLEVMKEIEEYKADIGFCGTTQPHMNCIYIPFYQDELIIAAPVTEHYRKIRSEKREVGWIREEPVILREMGSGTRQEALDILSRFGIREQDLNVIAVMTNTTSILQAVKKGLGITLISRLAAQEMIDEGSLLMFPISENGALRNLNLVYNSRVRPSEKVRNLIHITRELYGSETENTAVIPEEER